MKIFDIYAKYYDLLYKDKDYVSEANYINNLIKSYLPEARTILDLGCGTGRHDFILADKGYSIIGIDLSKNMIDFANKNLESNGSLSQALNFIQGDIRNISLGKKFDIIIALFHVMSYQTANEDLRRTLETVTQHLEPKGIFIFDFWYGPAVLNEKPEVRIKKLEDEKIKVIRLAKPEIKVNENTVDVNYTMIVKDKKNNSIDEIKETHSMRYLFIPEIKILLDEKKMLIKKYEEWISGNELGFKSWSGLVIAGMQKNNNKPQSIF